MQPVDHRHQMRRAVRDGCVDDLPAPARLRLEKSRQHPDHEIERTAREVAEEVHGRRRRLALATDRGERARERDVIEIVPRRLGERPRLAEPGHAAVDEARVPLERDVRPEAEPLHRARAETFEAAIGGGHQAQRQLDALRALEVERDGTASPQQEIEAQRLVDAEPARLQPIDADDLRAEIGEQHRGHRPRPDAGEFNDAQSRERPHEYLVVWSAHRRGRAVALRNRPRSSHAAPG